MANPTSYVLPSSSKRFEFEEVVTAKTEITVSVDGVVVAPTEYTVEGLGTGKASVVVEYLNVPATGTLKISKKTLANRVSDFFTGGVTAKALDDEFDNVLNIIDDLENGVGVSLTTLDARVTVLEDEDFPTSIADLYARSLLEDSGDNKFDAESKVIKNLAAPTTSTDAARLADVSAAASTGLPSKTGNALKFLRVAADELSELWTTLTAAMSSYNNATSGLTATDVQAAIDELVAGNILVWAAGGEASFGSAAATNIPGIMGNVIYRGTSPFLAQGAEFQVRRNTGTNAEEVQVPLGYTVEDFSFSILSNVNGGGVGAWHSVDFGGAGATVFSVYMRDGDTGVIETTGQAWGFQAYKILGT